MAYTTINKGSSYFNTVLYAGNGSATQAITGVGFKPDFVWVKNRTAAVSHCWVDGVRAAPNQLGSDLTDAENTGGNSAAVYGGVSVLGTDGFTVSLGSDPTYQATNKSAQNYAAWNWLASNTTTSNTAGTITSTVSVNSTAGFSIVSYTATSGTSSIGHGLGVAPSMIILKTRNQTGNWITGLAVNGWDKYLTLDTTNANVTDDRMFSPSAGTDPTSTLFWSNQSAIGSAGTMIAYCFAEVKGYSKFGSYTGNGSTDGTFVYCGFLPSFVLFKRTDSAFGWYIYDTKRRTFNQNNVSLSAQEANAEDTASGAIDILSNGFKLRNSDGSKNASGGTYIYMAFAENPFVTSGGIPVTAR